MTTKNEQQNTTELLIWKIPEELKSSFKARCAAQEKTMREVILEFMEAYSR